MNDGYYKEIVTRSAPRWVWELIDETLHADSQSSAFDKPLREQIGKALQAMIDSCENPTD